MATYGIFGENYGGVPGGFNITYAPQKPWGTSSGSTPYAPPAAPNTPTVNPGSIPANNAAANLAATPYNVQLADIINATNRAAQEASNKARLGPQGEQIQSNLLGNLEKQSAGLLDPQTEQMLRAGIAQSGAYTGMGVDSANLASAYRRALGQTIEGTEANAQNQYLALLAANPSAPIYDMGNTVMNPATYASAANEQANRELQAQLAQQELAYKYAALNASMNRGAGGGGRGGGGGYGYYTPPATSAGGVTWPVYSSGGESAGTVGTLAPFTTSDWQKSISPDWNWLNSNYDPYSEPEQFLGWDLNDYRIL